MATSIKTINANIRAISLAVGKARDLAFQTMPMCLAYGQETRHYDRVTALLNAVQSNKSLTNDLLLSIAGKVPHSIVYANDIQAFKLGKRDDSKLLTLEELDKIASEKAAKQAETSEKTKTRLADNKRKLEQFDAIAAKVTKLESENAALKAGTGVEENKRLKRELATMRITLESAEEQATIARNQIASLKTDLENAKNEIERLAAQLLAYQVVRPDAVELASVSTKKPRTRKAA